MRGMEKALKAAVMLGTLIGLGVGTSASAQTCSGSQDPGISVCVSGAPSVVYSQTGAPTFWTITVEVRNNAANTLNRVQVGGTLLTTAIDATAVKFVDPLTGVYPATNPVYLNNPAPSISCTAEATTISCGGVGTSIPAGQTLSFNLMTSTPPDQGRIDFNWSASFAEGNSTSDGSNNGAAQVTGMLTTFVVPPSGNSATASFPAAGGTLATAPDTFTTKIQIPTTAKSTNATITESELPIDPLRPCNSFKTCYESFVSIPGFVAETGTYLKIGVYMDKQNIRKGAKIESVLIYYTGVDSNDQPINQQLIELCPGFGTPAVAPLSTGMPCISKRVFYKNNKVPGWTPTLDGDFYWEAINTRNGRYDLF